MNTELKDICDIKINPNLPPNERKAEYIRQIVDPYNFKCGKIKVKVKFSEDIAAETLESKITEILSNEITRR